MPVIVTLDMYSGLPNPSWELSETQAAELVARLSQNRTNSLSQSAAALGLLGYRGFIVETVAEPPRTQPFRCFDGIIQTHAPQQPNYVDQNSDLESFLLSTATVALTDEERQYIGGEITKNVTTGVAANFGGIGVMVAPPFDPGKWNNNLNVLRSNNCYNYANDLITNTFAQPGRGSGQVGPYPPSCSGTGAAAQRDGQIPVPPPAACPAEGHYVALVVSTTPGFLDYHWYRQDIDITWSHKPGGTPAKNTDNSGNRIADPRTCNRGPYNLFCGFYHCIPGQVRIR